MSAPQIPDDPWGNRDGLLSRVVIGFGGTRLGSWIARTLMPLDRKLLMATGGRRTLLGPIGAPILVLETVGRKSGLTRLSPLLYAREGDSVIVAGSNFGQDHHPAWTANLIARPEARIVVGGRTLPVTATLLAGEEARAGWNRMRAVAQVYATYEGRTDRTIRVFRLRVGGADQDDRRGPR